MRNSILLFCLCFYLPQLEAAPGMDRQPSNRSVADTMERLEGLVAERGFRVFARIDHAAGAAGVGMQLRPTRLLLFGKPKAGTVLMQSAQSVAIDLPLKYLVWEDQAGQVWIGWNAPGHLARRHGLAGDMPLLGRMGEALAGMAKTAAAP
jgi:uncharacterized protein (DUF302 family)